MIFTKGERLLPWPGSILTTILFYCFLFLPICWNLMGVAAGENRLRCPSVTDKPVLTALVEVNRYEEEERVLREGETLDSSRFKLMCVAPYPVVWEFNGNTPPPSLYVEGDREVDNVLHGMRDCFQSNLTVYTTWKDSNETSRTGLYTCKSLNGDKASSKYIFVYEREAIFNSKEAVEVQSFATGRHQQVVVPCPSNVANLKPTISKINTDGKLTSLPKEISAEKYDPQTGFLLKAASSSNLAGMYACSGSYKGSSQVVRATVLAPINYVVSPSTERVTFEKSMISVHCNATEPVEISVANGDKTFQYDAREYTYTSADLFSHGVEANIPRPSGKHVKGDIKCIKKSSKEVLFTWHYDTAYECQCNWNNTDQKVRCFSDATGKVALIAEPCRNAEECRIKLSYNYPSHGDLAMTEEENATSVDFSWRRSAILRCSAGGFTTTKLAIAILQSIYIDQPPVDEELVQVKAIEKNVFFGDKIRFECDHDAFHFQKELAKWAFVDHNGQIRFVDAEPGTSSSSLNDFSQSFYIRIPSLTVTTAMCFVPQWGTAEWKNASLALNVHQVPALRPDSHLNCPLDDNPIVILERENSYGEDRYPHLVTNNTVQIDVPSYSTVELRLKCRSEYPVQWMRKGEMIDSKLEIVNCSSNSTDRTYESVLTLPRLKSEDTGFYNCTNALSGSPQGSIFIFATGEDGPQFVNEGGHFNVTKTGQGVGSWTILPCGLDDPQATPYLFTDGNGNLTRLNIGDNLRYNPKVGFQINISSVSDSVTGFVCSLKEDGSTSNVVVSLLKESKLGVDNATKKT